jgi:hypothetical protein
MADNGDEGHENQDVPRSWDRVGQFWSDLAAVSQGIAQRNQDLWNQVSGNLRDRRYAADDLTTDVARAWAAAMDNLDDLWTLATRPPEREQVATALPTVFLRFRRTDGIWNPPDPVWIRIPFWDRDNLTGQAELHLAGDPEGVRLLERCIRIRRRESAYLLTVAAVPQDLVEGFYDGIVTARDRPLASLRVLVRERNE